MKSLVLKKLLIVGLILTIFIPIITYAIDMPNQTENKEEFFSVDENEVSVGEVVTMNISLDKIDYDNFEFVLISNTSLNDITAETEKVNTSIEEDQFKIISNKSELNMEKITLYYKIPEGTKIGTKINLIGTIKEYLETEDQEENLQEVTISITVVEKKEENNQNSNQDSNQIKDDTISQNNSTNQNVLGQTSNLNNQSTEKTQTTQTTQTLKTSSSTGSQGMQTETVTYNGESNNYLSSLEIDGYEISPTFSKTNNTYFINAESDVEKVTVNAIAEDGNAKVNIYGNDNIDGKQSKILVSVTAENGEVRIYRIFVIKDI